jgi:outer membrane protein TolC
LLKIRHSATVRPHGKTSCHIGRAVLFLGLGLAAVLAGCSSRQYAKKADKEVYRIIAQKEMAIFGRTNVFTIDTKYNTTADPYELKAQSIISERLEQGDRLLTLPDALQLAVERSRDYQLNKEQLYLTALTLTGERYEFGPKFFASSSVAANRTSSGDQYASVGSQVGASQFLRTGGRLGVALANDLLRYFTGSPRREAVSIASVNLVQPLLRGAGAKVAAENLTQAERNVVYQLRSFTQFQRTFAVGIVASYYRTLREKDTVRNQYSNYLRLKASAERSAAMAVDRLSPTQADQARQSELQARRSYIAAVKRYQDVVNDFKITLGIPIGVELKFDDKALDDIREAGMIPLHFEEVSGYRLAVTNQLDLLNIIDRFEDSQRKIRVFASALKPGLDLFANADLETTRPTDYTKFNIDNVRASAGVELDLPIDRLRQRNSYRAALVTFEREIRNLSLELDDLRRDISEGLRNISLLRETYRVQLVELALAERRVEREELLLKAGRSQIRDLLEAQDARVRAQNGVTQSLVDYHIARLNLLLRIGVLRSDFDKFWIADQPLPGEMAMQPEPANGEQKPDVLITPDQLFGN